MSQCNRCGSEITWKKPFTKGDLPLNMDNSPHSCKKPDTLFPEPSPKPKTTVKSPVNSPILKISDIIEEIKLLKLEFGEIECAKFESIMKYAISRMMRR